AEKNERLRRFQKKIEESILEKTSGELTAAGSPRATNTSYFVFPELENIDFLFLGLDQKKVVVSTGSSCKSRTRQPSRSLQAMGYSKQDSMRAVRISTGLFTTEQEVDEFLAAFFYSIQAAS
ncbi:MAG TPA: aminotransferase class V-fold PLP-dependent enzyme, partial [Leptospiraceae bacterium]|nr:aminotransferase class V-fold PLP-dependent enzyme [Leptospiraceae bacterium]